jgi:hypothetical protein
MDPPAVPVAGQKPTLEFAGHQASDVAAPVAGYVGDGAFERAASDSPYQQVIYRTRNHGDVTGLILLAALVSAVVVIAVVLARRTRRVSV